MAVVEAIQTIVLAVDTDYVELTLPTSGYEHLEIAMSGMFENAGYSEYQYLWLGASGSADTGANYSGTANRAYDTLSAGAGNAGITLIGYAGMYQIGWGWRSKAYTASFSYFLTDYANTNKNTSVEIKTAMANGNGGTSSVANGGYVWDNTATPNYARLSCDTGAATGFARNTQFTVYGYKSS